MNERIDLSVESQIIPYAIFPGDERITPEVYAECMLGRYASLLAYPAAAAGKFGLVTDVETAEIWKRVAVAGGVFDTFLDESPDRKRAANLYQQGINYMRGQAEMPERPDWAEPTLQPTIQLLDNAVATLPEVRRQSLYNVAQIIGEISVAKAKCEDVREYTQLAHLEGKLSGMLVSETVSENMYHQPNFGLFATWAINVMEAGTLADSAFDLKDDYRAGLTSVKPTRRNAWRVGIGAFKNAAYLFHERTNFSAVLAAYREKRVFKPAVQKQLH